MKRTHVSNEPGLVAAISILVAICVAVAVGLTLIAVWDFARDCERNGGTHEVVGTTSWFLHR